MEEMDLGKPRKRQSIGYLAQRILDRLPDHPKGQLISKCPYEKSVSSKNQRKYFWNSALKFFVAFRGLPGSSFGFLGAKSVIS